jgi:hypothetical protein
MGAAWRTVDLLLAGDRRAGRSLGELRDHLKTVRCDCLSYLVAALDVMLAMREGDSPRPRSSPAGATNSAWRSGTPTRSGGTAPSS